MRAILALAALLLLPALALAAIPDICGDGLVGATEGSDTYCTDTTDADRDGYRTDGTGLGYDCDDNDRMMFPGVYSADGCSAGEAKLCGSGGTYGSCATLCEATGTGVCYYVRPTGGSDSNNGLSYATAFQTLGCITDRDSGAPGCKVNLAAGDVVYLFDGTYSTTYTFYSSPVAFGLSDKDGTAENPITIKAFPGQTPIIDTNTTSASPSYGIYILFSNYVVLDGITVQDFYASAGVRMSELTGGTVRRMTIRDIDGEQDNNIAGLYFTDIAGPMRVHHNLIFDNYERGDTSGDNNANIVWFRYSDAWDGDFEFDHNVIGNSSKSNTWHCLKNKGDTINGSAHVHHNVFMNCYGGAVSWHTADVTVEDNLVYAADYICEFKLHASFSSPSGNQICRRNTGVNASMFWVRRQDIRSGQTAATSSVFDVTYNVASAPGVTYSNEDAMLSIDHYGSAGERTNLWPSKTSFGNNCYYNDGSAITFAEFDASGGGTRYTSFATWNSAGFDSSSFSENPTFNARHEATSANCDDKGFFLPTSGGGGGGGSTSGGYLAGSMF